MPKKDTHGGRVRNGARHALRSARDLLSLIRLVWRMVPLRIAPLPTPAPPTRTRCLLYVAYFSPPAKSHLGVQRTAKFIKYLTRRGWQITLVTTTPSPWQSDPDAELLPSQVVIEWLPPRRVPGSRGTTGRDVPDPFHPWIEEACAAAKRHANTTRFDAVIATGPPYSSLIAGALIAREHRLPLICDFRDPWSRVGSYWILRGGWRQKISRWLERAVLSAAARVIMVDHIAALPEYFALDEALLRAKTWSIPNGWDEEDFEGLRAVEPPADRFTVSYVGSLYDQSTYEALMAPFHEWARRHPADMPHIRLIYAGSGSDYFKRCTPPPCEWVDSGLVSHRDAIRTRLGSHLQIFCQPAHFAAHITSGKIFEILASRRPVLGITHPQGAVAELLAKAGHSRVVAPGDASGGVEFLRERFLSWRRGEPLPVLDPAHAGNYTRAQLATQLEQLLLDLLPT